MESMAEFPKIAKQALGGKVETPHPAAELLTAFAERRLDEAERESVLAHCSVCADCRQVLFLAQPEEEVAARAALSVRHWLRIPTLRWGVAFAAVAVVASAVMLMRPGGMERQSSSDLHSDAARVAASAGSDNESRALNEATAEKDLNAAAPASHAADREKSLRRERESRENDKLSSLAAKNAPHPFPSAMAGSGANKPGAHKKEVAAGQADQTEGVATGQAGGVLGGALAGAGSGTEAGGIGRGEYTVAPQSSAPMAATAPAPPPTSAARQDQSAPRPAKQATEGQSVDQRAANMQSGALKDDASASRSAANTAAAEKRQIADESSAAKSSAEASNKPSQQNAGLAKSQPALFAARFKSPAGQWRIEDGQLQRYRIAPAAGGEEKVAVESNDAAQQEELGAAPEGQTKAKAGSWRDVALPGSAAAKLVVATGNGVWVAGATRGLFHSTDAGARWQTVNGGWPAEAAIRRITFFDAARGQVVTDGGQQWSTADGGKSWSRDK